jgi:hypothetical protein
VKVDGASKGPILSFPFTNVIDDHTIAATCKLQMRRLYLPFIAR